MYIDIMTSMQDFAWLSSVIWVLLYNCMYLAWLFVNANCCYALSHFSFGMGVCVFSILILELVVFYILRLLYWQDDFPAGCDALSKFGFGIRVIGV
jgi:hypothetical protein